MVKEISSGDWTETWRGAAQIGICGGNSLGAIDTAAGGRGNIQEGKMEEGTESRQETVLTLKKIWSCNITRGTREKPIPILSCVHLCQKGCIK